MCCLTDNLHNTPASTMRLLLLLCLCAFGLSAMAQPFAIGRQTVTLTDPARSNRSIASEIFYPALTAGNNTTVASGNFPVIVFGHGFSMNYDAYSNFWNELVPQGYIIAFPKTEVGPIPFPSHATFAADMNYTVTWFIAENTTSASRYYQKLNGKYAVMGHSMGGGCSYLAAASNPNVTVIANFAAAETNPSAVTAAANISVPALVFGGSKDCVAPPASNQTLMYNALISTCKSYVTITDASHCQFGESNGLCSFGESSSCAGASYITRAAQHSKTFQYLNPFLRFYLKGDCTAWPVYQQLLASPTGAVVQNLCNYQLPTATINLIGNQNLCPGESAILEANSSSAYLWTGGGTTQRITVNQTGNYQLIVTDGVGCKDTATKQVNVKAIALTTSKIDVTCNGLDNGKGWAVASAGYGGFSYLWSGGTATVGNDSIKNLSPGSYTVVVRDANNCTTTSSFTIAEPSVLDVSIAASNLNCAGGNDGSIFAQGSGGNGGYTYQWSGGLSGQSLSNLAAGTYRLTLTDSKGCTKLDTVTLTQPAAMQVQSTIINANCGANDGEATLTVSGGAAPITFEWPMGDTTATVTGLAGGTYLVTITDGNSCEALHTVSISAPGTLVLGINTSMAICPGSNDGAAGATVSGGSQPYTYLWQGQPNATGDTATGYGAGSYLLTVTDDNGCTLTDTFTITEPFFPAPLIVSLSGTTLCEDDSTDLTTMGTYTSYLWNTGETTATIIVKQAGNYNCTVTESSGCTVSGVGVNITFNQNYLEPEILQDGDSLYISEGTVTAWFNNGAVVPGATGNYIINPEDGGYYAEVVDSNGCYYIAKSYTVTGIKESEVFAQLRVYPNPATNVLTIEGMPAGGKIVLMDLLGRAFDAEVMSSNTDVLQLQVGHLPAQLYLLQVVSGESRYICKVFISR
ncbi:hypothetical protein BH09BAC1_BH09BAC1_26830 [soil metagenome]